jgi:sigma-B regulation protein RsbU (phosphoserine phosphatase)
VGPSPVPLIESQAEDHFELAPCGYLLLAADGHVTRVNTILTHWLQMRADDIVDRPFRNLLTVPGRILYETNIAPLLRLQGGFEEVALDLIRGDDKMPVLLNAVAQEDELGNLLGVRMTLVRAQERRGYERDLQGREAAAMRMLHDAQAASELREQFIAVLGHDLRNPLASVSSGVRLLQRSPSKERADQIAAMMQASVLRMSALIENVLDFARGRLGGGISLQRAPADLEAAIAQVVDELRSAHPSRTFDTNYSLPPLVDCDAARMSQMLSNLIGNACTHGDHATSVVVGASVGKGGLEIFVANGGAQIPGDKLQSLFKPFSREPGSAPVQGLGLGLYIASEIARSHGGTLEASSSERETRFTFRMPLALA